MKKLSEFLVKNKVLVLVYVFIVALYAMTFSVSGYDFQKTLLIGIKAVVTTSVVWIAAYLTVGFLFKSFGLEKKKED